ncbi:MAG: DNA mismatch repair endonuclease MutL [Clostridia bacterium]|nr:DNA mismatch repair endonuclease MutL [Clostridia bacterium]
MAKINVLPFSVANLIAAGEVVDRPASVIKELMENAIDAGATRITVEIQNGGVTFMRVTDNGCGMTPEDLPIAIRRHATSKIREAEDLEEILTLGFRGEALAAIASVSDIRIISKTADAEYGAVMEAHGGEEITVTEQGCSTGTSVIVENLFANVPARRKFLKKDVTETMAVAANVEKLALSNPQISFRFVADGNVKLETAGDGNLKSTVYALYGREFANRLLEVQGENEGVEVSGFIGRTDNFKANRNFQNFFVNGRYVKSKTAMAALEQAYTSYMPPEKFPCCVLTVTVNPAKVDVNVHPAKLEVKFSNEKAIFEAVYYTVRSALESNVTRPAMKLETGFRRSMPTGVRLSDSTVPIEDHTPQKPLQQRQLSYDLKGETQPQPQMRMTAAEYREEMKLPPVSPPKPEKQSVSVKREEPQKQTEPKERSDVPQEPVKTPPAEMPPVAEETPKTQPVMAQKDAPVAEVAQSLAYRIVGDVFHSYVIVETGDKMLIIDQHAAHERILFEQLKAGLHEMEICSQILMLPIDSMMTAAEVEILKEYDGELKKIGFSLRYARNTVSADAIPEGIETNAVSDMLQTIAGRLLDNTGSVKLTRDIIFEKALYQAACKAAIKAGRAYTPEHIQWLVKKLMELPDITFCPHGRPVAMELSKKTLDRQFDRTGF